MNLREWLAERQENAQRLAKLRPGDGPGWLEDADYFRRAVEAVDELARLKRAAAGVGVDRYQVKRDSPSNPSPMGTVEGKQ